MDDYNEVKTIGQGSFGTVKLFQHKGDKELFAIKRIELKSSFISPNASEAQIMESFEHPCIVRCFKHFFYKDLFSDFLCIVMEYCPNGTLNKEIQERNGVPFSEDKILDALTQLIWAIDTVHKKNMIHRDIKPQNILVDKYGTLKLSDFGLCKALAVDLSFGTPTNTGTQQYMAPEIWKRLPYGTSADIWSLGCVLYELIELRPAFYGNVEELAKTMNADCVSRPVRPSVSKWLADLVQNMMKVDAKQRPRASDLLEIPAVQGQLKIVTERIEYRQRQTNLPRLNEIEREKFSSFNMFPLEPNNDGNYNEINFSEESNRESLDNWTEIVNGNEEVRFHFPPLHVLNTRPDVVVVLYGKRRGSEFRIAGGLHPEVSSQITSVTVRLQLTLELLKADKQSLVNLNDLVLTFNRQTVNRTYYLLFNVYDVSWSQLSASTISLVALIRITPTISPKDLFHYVGLAPMSSQNGDFGYLDWNNLDGTFKYCREWKKMVEGDKITRESAWLHFPPLILPKNTTVNDTVALVMFAKRIENDLHFWGGIHENVAVSVKELTISVHLEMQFRRRNGEIVYKKIEQSVMFARQSVEKVFGEVCSHCGLPWFALSPNVPPRASCLLLTTES